MPSFLANTTNGTAGRVDVRTKGEARWMRGWRTESLQAMLQRMCQASGCERSIQTYLGTAEYGKAEWRVPLLQANILLHALDPFLAEQGAEIEGAVNNDSLDDNVVAAVRTRMISLAPDVNADVPAEGLLFVRYRDGGRAIIGVDGCMCEPFKQITLFTADRRPNTFFDAWHEYACEHAYLRGQSFYASGEFIAAEPPVRLKDVTLPGETHRLIERLILEFPDQIERFRQHGLSCKRGVLLAGPPGTGKTMLCRALSRELKATFIWVTARHVDGDADKIAAIWDLARVLQPTVILLEDIDLFAESREHSYRSHELGELMNQMDGPQDNEGILTVATTNRLDVVEKALRNRPGRFDRVIHFGPPDEDGRWELLSRYLAAESPDIGVFEMLVRETEGFTGARLADLAKTIIEIAAEDTVAGRTAGETLSEEVIGRALEEVGCDGKKRTIGFVGE